MKKGIWMKSSRCLFVIVFLVIGKNKNNGQIQSARFLKTYNSSLAKIVEFSYTKMNARYFPIRFFTILNIIMEGFSSQQSGLMIDQWNHHNYRWPSW